MQSHTFVRAVLVTFTTSEGHHNHHHDDAKAEILVSFQRRGNDHVKNEQTNLHITFAEVCQ